jgi:transposase
MSRTNVVTIGIDLGKNTFHVVGFDITGAIILRKKKSRNQLEQSLANVPACLIGMEACSGAHHLGRKLEKLGHQVRLLPAQYVKPYLKGHKNDFRDAEAIAEATQRPTMRFVPLKSVEQLDLQALHRVRSRLVTQRTAVINQIRGFLLERGLPVRQGAAALRLALPQILSAPKDSLSPRVIRLIEDLAEDWRYLDRRVASMTKEIDELADQDPHCRRLMSAPGVGPIISSAMVAAIGTGDAFHKGRDFAAWLGLVPKQISTGDRTILGASRGAAIGTCERCSFKAPEPYFCSGRVGLGMASEPGWRPHPSGSTPMSWLLPWPQNSRAWPGACSQRAVTTTPTSWAAPHEKQGREGRSKVRSEGTGTVTRQGLRDGKDEWRNGSTDTSEAWFDAMAVLEAGELLRTEVSGYP